MTTRDDVLSAALRHLNAHPTASMAEIAEAAGISRATLHRHFANRDALIREIGERSNDRWQHTQDAAGIAEAAASGDPAIIRACAETLVRRLVADAEEFGFALADEHLYALPGIAERIRELFDRELDFWAAAQDAGVLRADLPARWIGHAAYGVLIASREALTNGDVARRDLPDLVLTTFFTGVSS